MITNSAPSISWHRTRENVLAARASPYSFLVLPTQDGAYRIAIAPELGTPPEQWAAEDFFQSSLFAPDETIARDHIGLLTRLHQELESPSVSRDLDPGTPTPWGDAHRATQHAEGFVRYSTQGPDGYHLDPTLNALVHPAYRREDGWYDDHIDWSKVAVTFPTLFPDALPAAAETLRHYEPKAYEQVNGIALAPDAPNITWHRTREGILAANASSFSFLALPTPDGAYRIAVAPELGTPPEQWAAQDFFRSSLFAPDETIARDHIGLLARLHQELESPVSRELDPGSPTLWGEAEESFYVAEGVVSHHTAGHGGLHLDPAQNALVHPAYRNEDGWYEEDVEWSKVAVTFPTLFPLDLDGADDLLREYQPDAYEEVNGLTAALPELEARDLDAERQAMRRLNLPEYAKDHHGYTLDWRNQTHTRAVLTRGDEYLEARKARNGVWTYENADSPLDSGDILDFEIHRGAGSRANARATIRPELAHVEREQGRLDPPPAPAQSPDARIRDAPEDDGPDHDRRPRPGRGR